MTEETYHIGEAAARAGLSLRTVRYYEDVGLVQPSGRTEGGFRVYRESDVQRLVLVRALKPTELSVEEIAEALALRDAAASGGLAPEREDRLRDLTKAARQRLKIGRERLIAAELAVELLQGASPAIAAADPAAADPAAAR